MRKILVSLLSLVIGLNIVSASTNTIPRTDEDLGVNKKWTINEKNIENVKRTPRVDASEKIYDFGEILTEEEEKILYEKIKEYISYTNMDMVILTVDMEYNIDSVNEDYAADFYDYNDFGIDFTKYSGILLLRNKYSLDPYFNIYTFGDAQLYYDYNTCESILDDIYYELKNHQYLSGFEHFISLSKSHFDNEKGNNYYIDDEGNTHINGYYVDENGYIHSNPPVYRVPIIVSLWISGIVTLIVILVLIKKNKMVKKETLASVYMDSSSVRYNKKIDQFLHSHTTSYTVSHDSGGHGGGGHSSHSGSSGGGHGGGGGRHG